MTEQKPFPPKLLKARMYEKKTKTGETFFAGTDGYLKTFMFKAKGGAEEDNVWLVYVVPRSEEEIAQRREQNSQKYGSPAPSPSAPPQANPNYAASPQRRNTQPLNNGPDDWMPF
jgi:hypothetical protein